MQELYKRTPFKEPLIKLPNDGNNHLFAPKNGEYIVRADPILRRHRSDAYVAKFLFSEIGDFGVAVPHFDIVIGPFPDQISNKGIYLVVETVEGAELSQADLPEDEAKKLFSSLLDYYESKYENGGYFLYDLSEAQFIYGNTKNDPTKRIYLIDLDPFYEYFDNLNPDARNEEYSTNLELLNDLLNILERRSKDDFGQLRKRYIEFLEKIKGSLHCEDRNTLDEVLASINKQSTEGMVRD